MVEIVTSTYGTFTKDKFAIASTSANTYYPFYSQFNSKRLVGDLSLYYKPVFSGDYGITRYNDMFAAFTDRMKPLTFKFTMNDEDHYFYVGKGFIFDALKRPLFILAVSDYKNSINGNYDHTYLPDYSKFKLFVASEFAINPVYTNIWRKIDKEYIQKCYEVGIDVEITTVDKIEKQLFSNEFKLDFSSINELQSHLQNNVNQLFFANPLQQETRSVNLVDEEEFELSVLMLHNEIGLPISVIRSFIAQYYSQQYANRILRFEYDFNGVITMVCQDSSFTRFFSHSEFIRFSTTGNTLNLDNPLQSVTNVGNFGYIAGVDSYMESEQNNNFTVIDDTENQDSDFEEVTTTNSNEEVDLGF